MSEQSDKKSSGNNSFYWGILFGIIAYYSTSPIIVYPCGALFALLTGLPLCVMAILLISIPLYFGYIKIKLALRDFRVKAVIKESNEWRPAEFLRKTPEQIDDGIRLRGAMGDVEAIVKQLQLVSLLERVDNIDPDIAYETFKKKAREHKRGLLA